MTTITRTTRTALAVLAAAGLALTAACSSMTSPGASGAPSEPTSTSTPSPIDSAPPAAGDPTPIPDDDPRLFAAVDAPSFPVVEWAEAGTTLTIMIGGSGSPACVPTPVGATVDGDTAITVEFTPPSGDLMCTADFRVYGWEIPVTEGVDATQTVDVAITGLQEGGEPTVVPLAP